MLVEIISGIGKSGKNQNLFVPGIDRRRQLALDLGLEVLQLGVILGSDLVHLGQEILDDFQISLKVVLPGRKIHIRQANLDLAPDSIIIEIGQIVHIRIGVFKCGRQIVESGIIAGLFERFDFFQRIEVIPLQFLQGQAEGLNGTLQPLKQVGRHERLKAAFPVDLAQSATPAADFSVVHIRILREATRQDVTDRGIDRELHQRKLGKDIVEPNNVTALGQLTVNRNRLATLRESRRYP